MSTKASIFSKFSIFSMSSTFSMFSMFSKLTPCSLTWDCRIQQLMQPWIWLETLTTQSAVPLEMYGPCCTAQFDSSIVTTCGQHCTLLYFVWKHRSSPFRQILVMLLVVVDGALRRKWAGADSFWVSCKPAACLSVVKKKVSQKESGGFGFLATLLVAEHNKVKI